MTKESRNQIALVGNPNAGKTTLFNALSGLNMKTSNYAGTTVERAVGRISIGNHACEVMDLPGMYSMDASSPEEQVATAVLLNLEDMHPQPDILIPVLDATNLERNLFLFSQLMECDLPMVVVLSMVDLAEQEGLKLDLDQLKAELNCPVIAHHPKSKGALPELHQALDEILSWGVDSYPRPVKAPDAAACSVGCGGCPFSERFSWSERVTRKVVLSEQQMSTGWGEQLDKVLTHPFWGLCSFVLIMALVFTSIFWLAQTPMGWIETLMGWMGSGVEFLVPEGDLQSLMVDGIVGGVGSTLVFLPQICILFFLLTLLEDSGYLSRAAFVMDRMLRVAGLPGSAFVPLLSGHACAIPAIMSTRVISNWRDRLVTILVLPLASCGARLPVYSMVAILVFPNSLPHAVLLFTAAYFLGICAALLLALVLRQTILRGPSDPLLIELPRYKEPSLNNALRQTWRKGLAFLKQAGSIILVISVVLWVLSTYPKREAVPGEDPSLSAVLDQEYSFAGRMGKAVEPVIKPLGFDWRIGIGIMASFAAREVVVASLAITYGLGDEASPEEVAHAMREARDAEGRPQYSSATGFSLLVFFVLAMQCLPTQAVTRKETGSWKWPLLQLSSMTLMAYLGSLATFQILSQF